MQTYKTTSDVNPNALHEAAAQGDIIVLQKMLDAEADINTLHTEKKISALAVACENGHLEAVKFLIGKGADVKAGGLKMRRGVLDYAAEHPVIADWLLDKIKQASGTRRCCC